VFVDDALISLGSQNLTARGAKNLEATLIHPGSMPTQRQRAALEAWKAAAVLLTQPMLDEMAKWLPECQKAHAAYREEITEAEVQIASALIRFTKERQDFEKAFLLANHNFGSRLDKLDKELSSTSLELTREEAERLCRACAEVGNPSGYKQASNFRRTLFEVDDEGFCWNNSGEHNTN